MSLPSAGARLGNVLPNQHKSLLPLQVLGWYLEQVLPTGTGARRNPLFFIQWMWLKVGLPLLVYPLLAAEYSSQ